MRVINAKVPRNLISKFYPHPEVYGDFVVDLVNGMYTDVYYHKKGDFYTPTNDKKLVKYLRKHKMKPRDYFYRNGIFAFRTVLDCDLELLESWKDFTPITSAFDIPITNNLRTEFMFCYKWAEVGKVSILTNTFYLSIFEKDLIENINVEMIKDFILDYINQEVR